MTYRKNNHSHWATICHPEETSHVLINYAINPSPSHEALHMEELIGEIDPFVLAAERGDTLRLGDVAGFLYGPHRRAM